MNAMQKIKRKISDPSKWIIKGSRKDTRDQTWIKQHYNSLGKCIEKNLISTHIFLFILTYTPIAATTNPMPIINIPSSRNKCLNHMVENPTPQLLEPPFAVNVTCVLEKWYDLKSKHKQEMLKLNDIILQTQKYYMRAHAHACVCI